MDEHTVLEHLGNLAVILLAVLLSTSVHYLFLKHLNRGARLALKFPQIRLGYGEFKTESSWGRSTQTAVPRHPASQRFPETSTAAAPKAHGRRIRVGTPPAPRRFLNAGPHPSQCTHHPCSGGIGPARGRSFGDPAKCFDQVSLQARKNLTENQKIRIRPG